MQRRFQTIRGTGLICALAAGLLPGFCVTPAIAAARDDVLEAEPIEITAAAGEAQESGAGGAVAVQVIDSQTLREIPSSNVADALGRLPGFRVQTRVQGERSAVSIEGLPPEYTRIVVDGRRYTGKVGGVADLADVPIDDVERIEVIRGAQALRWGAEAGGGVIHVITRRAPRRGLRADASLAVGSDHQRRAVLGTGARIGQSGVSLRWSHDGIGGYDADPDSDAVFSASGGERSRDRTEDVHLALEHELSERTRLEGGAGYRREHERLVPEDGSSTSERDVGRWLGGGALTVALGVDTNASLDVAWFHSRTDSDAGRPFVLRESESRWRGFLDHVLETGPLAHALAAGVDLARPTLHLRESTIGSPAIEEASGSLGVVMQDEIELLDRITLSLGVRGELHDRFQPRWLPQVALLGRLHDRLRLRGSIGWASRAPSLPDLYQPPVPQLGGAYYLSGNTALGVEASRSLRVGFELGPIGSFSVASTLFWNRVEDLIRSVQDGEIVVGTSLLPAAFSPGSGVCFVRPDLCVPVVSNVTAPLFRKQNLDRVWTRGLETQIGCTPIERVRVEAGWTWLVTRVEAANLPGLRELPNEPRHTLDLRTTWRVPRLGTTVVAEARWRGRAITETSGTGLLGFAGSGRSRPSWIADLRISQPLPRGFELFVDFRNVFDQPTVDSYQVRGRTMLMGLRASFSSDRLPFEKEKP